MQHKTPLLLETFVLFESTEHAYLNGHEKVITNILKRSLCATSRSDFVVNYGHVTANILKMLELFKLTSVNI